MDLLTKHKLLRHVETASGLLGLPTSESEMRTSIIKMILATDMIFHYELQENLANILEIISDDQQQQHQQHHHPQQTQSRSVSHKPVLPSTAEENEEEDDEGPIINSNNKKNHCCHHREQQNGDTITAKKKESHNNDHDHNDNDDVQVKDIFSSQGAKSAISYFRKKSYYCPTKF